MVGFWTVKLTIKIVMVISYSYLLIQLLLFMLILHVW